MSSHFSWALSMPGTFAFEQRDIIFLMTSRLRRSLQQLISRANWIDPDFRNIYFIESTSKVAKAPSAPSDTDDPPWFHQRAVLKGQLLTHPNLWNFAPTTESSSLFLVWWQLVWHLDLSTASRAALEQSSTTLLPAWISHFNQLNIVFRQACWQTARDTDNICPSHQSTGGSWKSSPHLQNSRTGFQISVCLPSCKTAM